MRFFLFRRIDRTLQRAFKSFVVCSLFAATFSISSHSGYIVLLLHRYIKSNEEVLQWIRAIVLCGMLTFGCDKEWLAFEMSYVLCGNQFSVMCWKHIKFQFKWTDRERKTSSARMGNASMPFICSLYRSKRGEKQMPEQSRCDNWQNNEMYRWIVRASVCVGESNSIPVATHNNPTLLWAIQCAELKWLN